MRWRWRRPALVGGDTLGDRRALGDARISRTFRNLEQLVGSFFLKQ